MSPPIVYAQPQQDPATPRALRPEPREPRKSGKPNAQCPREQAYRNRSLPLAGLVCPHANEGPTLPCQISSFSLTFSMQGSNCSLPL